MTRTTISITKENIDNFSYKFYVLITDGYYIKLEYTYSNRKIVPKLNKVAIIEQATIFSSLDDVRNTINYVDSCGVDSVDRSKFSINVLTSFCTSSVELDSIYRKIEDTTSNQV